MKLPKMTAGRVPAMVMPQSRPAGPPAASVPRYDLLVCTANLGASDLRPGHPSLKHCFARLTDGTEADEETLAYGRSGFAEEPYPDVASARCQIQARGLTPERKDAFVAAFKECAGRPYAWGSNDCCSCVDYAVRQGLAEEPSDLIRSASRQLKNSPEIVP